MSLVPKTPSDIVGEGTAAPATGSSFTRKRAATVRPAGWRGAHERNRPSRWLFVVSGFLLFLLGRRRGCVVPVVAHLVAGVLLGLAFACFVLPAFIALAGPDQDEGCVSPGWLRRHREGR